MGFLFVEPKDPNETTHIFPAYQGTDGKYHTFNDEFDSIEAVEDTDENSLILEEDSDDNKAICHGVTCNDIGQILNIFYFDSQAETRTHAANRQNAGRNICGNCVRRLYKNDDDN